MQILLDLKRNSPVILLVLLYLAANMIFTYNEFYWLNTLPFVGIFIYLTIARIDIAYYLIIACTPLSVQFLEFMPGSPLDFAIPTEPLLFGVLVILVYRSAQIGVFHRQTLNHPLSYAVLVYLFWIFITSVTSSMPLVSFKYLLARIWFIAVFYFLAILILKNSRSIQVFILCYTIPMLGIVIYSLSRHLSYGLFDKKAAHFVMEPFFRDHTSYGAVLAILFFATGGLFLNKKRNILYSILLGGSWLLLATGLLLSYTRAAWISVVVAFCVLILIHFKVKVKYLILPVILIAVYLIGQRSQIVQKMEKNRQVSSAAFSEHIKSISNITTDDSNLERLNRWNAAFRMAEEKPFFGWGPGTYMFKYAPYQRSYDKTAISTDFGDLGNAHSEYIGPLVEMGIPGLFSFLLICITGIMTGMRVYRQLEDKKLKRTVLFLFLGFVTYLIHGMLNNFLDTDKASALFWGILAIFVSMDLSLKELNAKH